jgi:hypothetical protein
MNDAEMDLFYKSRQQLYSEQAGESLPKNFMIYECIGFLNNHPKFCSVVEMLIGGDQKGVTDKAIR